MPTYEFRLPDGTIIERSFKISEVPDEIPNPNGEGSAVRIISGGAGLLFKGSGFYLTDYGRNAHRTQGDAPKPSSGAAASPSESGSKESGSKESGSKESGSKGAPSTPAPSGGSDAKPAAAPKSDTKPSSGGGPAAL